MATRLEALLAAAEGALRSPKARVRALIERGDGHGHVYRDRLIVLNMGLGRDSMAMLALLAEGKLQAEGHAVRPQDLDAIVFSDPGLEWSHTYAAISDVERLLGKIKRLTGVQVPFFVLSKPTEAQANAYLSAWRRAAKVGDIEKGAGHAPFRFWRHKLEESSIEEKAEGGYYHIFPTIDIHYAQGRPTPYSIKFGDTACTDAHKVQVIRRFMEDLGKRRFGEDYTHKRWAAKVRLGTAAPHLNLLGIALGEGSDDAPRAMHMHPYSVENEAQLAELNRRMRAREAKGLSTTKIEGKIKSLTKDAPVWALTEAYPLVELGISKEDEAPILRRHGLDHIKKSGCMFCHSQPAEWYFVLAEQARRGEPGAEAALKRIFAYERASFEHRDENGRRGKPLFSTAPWQLEDPSARGHKTENPLRSEEDRRLLPEILPLITQIKIKPRLMRYMQQGLSLKEAVDRVMEDILAKDYAQGCR